jgi:hypothetical protein
MVSQDLRLYPTWSYYWSRPDGCRPGAVPDPGRRGRITTLLLFCLHPTPCTLGLQTTTDPSLVSADITVVVAVISKDQP